MKIIIFQENETQGGLDTFCKNLIEHWPSGDSFVIVCNSFHEGIPTLKKKKNAQVYEHNILINWQLMRRMTHSPKILNRIIAKFLRLGLIMYQRIKIRKLFLKINADELIVVNGSFPGGETCRQANIVWNKVYKKKSLHTLHGFAVQPNFLNSYIEHHLTNQLIDSNVEFISVSNYVKDSIVKYPGFRSRVSTIYNGTSNEGSSTDVLNLRKIIGLGAESKILIMLGSYHVNKGHEFLFKVMEKVHKKYNDCHLVTFGGHEAGLEKIKILANKSSSSDKIHILAYINDARNIIKQANILVAPTQTEEAFGLSVIESMANSIPVVCTNVGGMKEIFGDNNPPIGMISRKDDIAKFSDNIIKLLNDEELCNTMGVAGKERVDKYFSAQIMAHQYYQRLSNLK